MISSKSSLNLKSKYNLKVLKIRKAKIKLSRITIKLTNLFNGDKALGSNLNVFLNENWRDVWVELQPSIHSAIAEVMKSIMREIFTKFSYDEIFLD